ncbi:MAG TPA: ATP-binding protein, partial [Actinomycetota bacterium]
AKARLRIFDPFFQVSDERARHGQASSGLGLALTRRLVEALGGTIRLAAVRKGAKFVFTLPVANELSPVPPQRAASRLAH